MVIDGEIHADESSKFSAAAIKIVTGNSIMDRIK